jgi:hypothetical protein
LDQEDQDYYTQLGSHPASPEMIDAIRHIRDLAQTGSSTNSDPFTQCHCKYQLYLLKCYIDDLYKDMPEFPSLEKEWEQKRLVEILKKR